MNEPDGQRARDTEPRVRSERERCADRIGRDPHLADELYVDLFALEHERSLDQIVVACARGHARRDEQQRTQHSHAWTLPLLALFVGAGCHHDLGQVDTAFYTWDQRKVHCAVNIDTYARIEQASIETGLDRARDTGEVLELYTHDPGRTIEWSALEAVLAAATSRGLSYVTYADMAHGVKPAGGGLALGFDDAYVPDWMTARDLFMRYGARVTFFVTYWDQLNDTDRMSLHVLEADGHDIEAHSVKHRRGPDFVEAEGLATYMSDEVQPSIDHLVDDGFEITTYAYPFGARTSETDSAILGRVQQLRSVTYTWDSPAVDPCPN